MFIAWCLIIGVLLVVIGLTDTVRQQLPFSASALYLMAGYLLGPEVFGMLRLTLADDAVLLEHLTEAAVLVSLFAVGLRLRTPVRDPLWIGPLLMATVGMVLTVGLLTVLGLGLGLSVGAAVLMAAVLSPTDPVLASDVQVQHAGDRDRLRFSLTGEGGLNDGTAFPFVMLALGLLGLNELGPYAARWWAVDVLWATAGGIGTGWLLGWLFSRAVVWLRSERKQALGMESFLALGLIALTYGIALGIHTYGFLAVFAAGLAMRQVEPLENAGEAEAGATGETVASDTMEDGGASNAASPEQASAYMANAVLDFTLDLEKLVELTVMLLIGSLLTLAAFTPTSLLVAAALLFLVRPLAIVVTTWRLPLSRGQRRLAAWFGVRGIGSMYYLAYAVAHGAGEEATPVVADAVLVTIVLSVLLHGSSATPIMRLYHRARGRRPA
jgi:NhaP-type Na+/H+ or K+/H+ antiporter